MAVALLNKQLTQGDLISKFIINTNKMGPVSAEVLQQRIILVDQYWDKCLQTHHQLCLLQDELKEDDYFKEDSFATYESVYLQAKADLTTRLAQKIGELQATTSIPPQSSVVPVHVNSTASSLPKLSLPKFSGVQAEWDSFKERFCSLVKDQATLQPVLKLQHLLACLEGDAARRLRNMEIIGSNFEVAWAALVRRYDNQRLKLAVQFNKLLSMPTASSKSVAELTRLLDVTDECRRALRLINRPVDQWDDWFVHLIVYNLDADTREDWEKSLEGSTEFPTYKQLVTFVEGRTQSLDTAHCNTLGAGKQKYRSSPPSKPNHNLAVHHSSEPAPTSGSRPPCIVCKAKHYLPYCEVLGRMAVDKRLKIVKEHRLCQNCLRSDHSTSSCPSTYRCRFCAKNHHSLLHSSGAAGAAYTQAAEHNTPAPNKPVEVSTTSVDRVTYTTSLGSTVLLGTASVFIESKGGGSMLVRALIDPASEGSFVSEKVVQTLSLSRLPSAVTVSGVGGKISAKSSHITSILLKSRVCPNSYLSLSAAVLPRLTALLPRREVRNASWNHLQGLPLADPDFHQPAPIDCIIGADAYPSLVLPGLRRGPAGSPVAQHTRLGWILVGPTEPIHVAEHENRLSFNTTVSVSTELRRFWEVEELTTKLRRSPDEAECEDHFSRTHKRDSSGRYVVRLPFRRTPALEGSRTVALQRFLSLERRLARDCDLRESYTAFVDEYERLHHLEEIPAGALSVSPSYYLPHHAVVSADGEPLQSNICTILTRWRMFRFVFTADIVKMFRQILVDPADATWQRILWRRSPDEEVRDLWLLTVTYGTASAPFLALRVLQQLAEAEGQRFPIGARILRNHMYADDACAGADSLDEATLARDQLIAILDSAGMSLDKWAANDTLLLPNRSPSSPECIIGDREPVSILGLRWYSHADAFGYKVQAPPVSPASTKRAILSEVAKLYDPLGWLSPVIVMAKMLLQDLWISGHDWDAPVSSTTQRTWTELRSQLTLLENLRLPRWIFISPGSSWELHGFSDASEKAYAAAVFIVSTDPVLKTRSTLLAAKSKVAPIKTISLPRLELCGALLLSRLITQVREDLQVANCPVFCWTDSQVVLAWLRGIPSSWHTFVANRVSEIVTSLPEATWRHVRSSHNPADCASRGLLPSQLLKESLWWAGPSWLITPQRHQTDELQVQTLLERKSVTTCHISSQTDVLDSMYARVSTWRRLLRVVVYALRWRTLISLRPPIRRPTLITAEELDRARIAVFKAVQSDHFAEDLRRLQDYKVLSKDNPLRRLRPFLDKVGLMRVGGRLHFSFLSFPERHPIIVPKTSRLAKLLIHDAHEGTLHGGPQLVLSHLLRTVWIVHARNQVRQLVRQCVACTRYQGRPQQQQMAPIPSVRLTPSRPFSTTGVDYAGPFAVRTSKGRGQHSSKGYVAIFICMVTRAVHLEVVSDYSAPTFLMAFKRFTARRGLCRVVYSDNGTTFQGAESELKRLFHQASSFSQEVAAAIAADGVTWSFIPPRAPHFGGLWEAAVKSFKHHLRRVLGSATLTFEELSTLCAQIEACLNSRPLSPLSSSPDDVTALTPGHFLIGAALTAPPEPFSDFSVSGLRRWQMVTNMRNHFWKRWRKEVLHHLQVSSKWFNANRSLQVGDLVLLTDDLQPPQKWPVARIQQLHPGPDGLTRVLTLKTPTTTLMRPLTKVIALPISQTPPALLTSDDDLTAGGGQPNASLDTPAMAGGQSQPSTT